MKINFKVWCTHKDNNYEAVLQYTDDIDGPFASFECPKCKREICIGVKFEETDA